MLFIVDSARHSKQLQLRVYFLHVYSVLCEVGTEDDIVCLLILAYVLALNLFNIVSSVLESTFDNTKDAELPLVKIKTFIESFTKELMEKIKLEDLSIKTYGSLSAIFKHYFTLLDTELSISPETLAKSLAAMHNSSIPQP